MDSDFTAFIAGTSPEDRLESLGRLMAGRKIRQLLKSSEFMQGLTDLMAAVERTDTALTRLRSVAYLTKLAVMAKPARNAIDSWLGKVLKEPLPAARCLTSGDDRAYVARACALADRRWCAAYLAQGAVAEESAEKARLECVKSLVTVSPDLESALAELVAAWKDLEFETASPAESAGRRLRRLFTCLRQIIESSAKEPGRGVGRVLGEMARTAFKDRGAPRKFSILRALAEETLGLVHALIRARFSLATEATTFHALRAARMWMSEDRWESFVKSSKVANAVARDLLEAIKILAKQGQTDDTLRSFLEIAEGSRRDADRALEDFTKEASGLSDEVKAWLLRKESSATRKVSSSGLAAESQRIRENSMLGDMLIDAEQLFALGIEIGKTLAPGDHRNEGRPVGDLRSYVTLGTALADAVRSFARKRELQVRGRKGDEIEYSPLEHEILGGERMGVRMVKIIRPAVVQLENGVSRVIISKGLVEPA